MSTTQLDHTQEKKQRTARSAAQLLLSISFDGTNMVNFDPVFSVEEADRLRRAADGCGLDTYI